jgi:hypothetical protein
MSDRRPTKAHDDKWERFVNAAKELLAESRNQPKRSA